MTRVHDMGGRFGDGPVIAADENAPIFAHDWHARAMALVVAAGALGIYPIDISRRARESVPAKDYTRFSYYEKWLAGLANVLVEKGLVAPDELTGGASGPSHLADRCLLARDVAAVLARGAPADRPAEVAVLFAPGDAVRAVRPAGNRAVAGGHTRLPVYAAGAQGRILRLHGHHVLPDSAAHDLGEAPEPLYAVAFPAAQLWTHPEHPNDEVVLDLWQSYLEPAS